MARSENTCTNLYQARGPRRTLHCVDSMTHPLLRHRRAGCECAARYGGSARRPRSWANRYPAIASSG